MENVGKAVRFVFSKIWDGTIIGVPVIYGLGSAALFGNEYRIAVALFFAAIAWATAKAFTWGEARGHEHSGWVRTLILVVGCSAFALSFLWTIHRKCDSDLVFHSSANPPQTGTQPTQGPAGGLGIVNSPPSPPPITAREPTARLLSRAEAQPRATFQRSQSTSNQAPDGAIHGADNTIVGNVPIRSVTGSGNTVVGATDSHGNTILNRGGVAIGNGARADSTSIAIGAHAGSGGGRATPQA